MKYLKSRISFDIEKAAKLYTEYQIGLILLQFNGYNDDTIIPDKNAKKVYNKLAMRVRRLREKLTNTYRIDLLSFGLRDFAIINKELNNIINLYLENADSICYKTIGKVPRLDRLLGTGPHLHSISFGLRLRKNCKAYTIYHFCDAWGMLSFFLKQKNETKLWDVMIRYSLPLQRKNTPILEKSNLSKDLLVKKIENMLKTIIGGKEIKSDEDKMP